MKNSNDTIGNRTRDLPACSALPQPTAPPRTPSSVKKTCIFVTEHPTLKLIQAYITYGVDFYYSHLKETTKKTGDRLNSIFNFAETWKGQLM